MDFYEVLDQVLALLRSRGRVTYRALQRQFDLDDDVLEDLKEEILYSQPQVVDDEGKGLIWTGETVTQPEPESSPQPALPSDHEPVQPTQAEPPTPDAERRQLTVMFCDLADSTRLSAQLDPEDLRDVIRAYQSTSTAVIARYAGYIAQHLGDGLMVYFGWPQAHEDDAQRAVHVGLGIVGAMHGLNAHLEQEKGICLSVRIGIHTGLVVVGEVSKKGAAGVHMTWSNFNCSLDGRRWLSWPLWARDRGLNAPLAPAISNLRSRARRLPYAQRCRREEPLSPPE